jgi:hypothetical protein
MLAAASIRLKALLDVGSLSALDAAPRAELAAHARDLTEWSDLIVSVAATQCIECRGTCRLRWLLGTCQ